MKMEQAPPAPPREHSPQLYMTPQLQKRRDGLCPGLFLAHSDAIYKRNSGGVSKEYRTNSKLLLQIEEREGIPREILELQTIVDSVSAALKEFVSNSRDVISLDFIPKGCIWIIELNSGMGEADECFRLEVRVLANDINGITNYVVDTILQPKMQNHNSIAPPLPGTKEAKPVFDLLCIAVRKSVVRLEFPEFPEGCKGVAFREIYQLNARLKSGSFATVCRGTHRATGRKVAIKCVLRKDLPPSDDAAIYDEVAILASLNHPHIVPIIDFFDEKDCYFIVMELMSGGDLFDRIGQKKSYSEADARDLIVKMLKAVAYCHIRQIAHCDMKPKNLLLMSDDNDSYIKLADFGFSARVHEPKSLTKQCGTPFFVAPEILLRKGYDQQSDMWSVGCIIFLLLSGQLPFMGRSQKELFRKIVAGKYEFGDKEWEGVSDEARDLVRGLLVLDPDQRLTATQAVRHRWLKASRHSLSLINLQNTSQRLKTFNARMKLRSAVIAVDWVSSLKRMSWISSRNIGSLSDDASVGSATSRGSERLLAVAAISRRRMDSSDDNSSDLDSGGKLGGSKRRQKLGSSHHGKSSSDKKSGSNHSGRSGDSNSSSGKIASAKSSSHSSSKVGSSSRTGKSKSSVSRKKKTDII